MNKKDISGEAADVNWPYCAPLMCGVNYIGSSSLPGVVLIDMEQGHCCDMRGAINVCELLWPGCHEIRTSSIGRDDVVYLRRGEQWMALERINKRKAGP